MIRATPDQGLLHRIDDAIARLDLPRLARAGLHRDPGSYNLVVHFLPPEVARDHAATADLRARLAEPTGPVGLYLHIPPCTGRCTFCHYAIEVNPATGELETYLEGLRAEITARWSGGRVGPVRSVLVGGGTPTFLSAAQLDRLLSHLHETVELPAGIEFTLESSPETLTGDKLEVLLGHGVNRLNIGLQALDDALLLTLARRHDARAAVRAVELAHAAGMPHVNIDLIYALPGQSLHAWIRDLELAADLGVSSITAYHLRKRPDTRISRHASPDPRLNLEMHVAAGEVLGARGYRQTLLDNFSRAELDTAQVQARDKWRDMQPVDGCGSEACSRRPDVIAFDIGTMAAHARAVRETGGWPLAHGRFLSKAEQMAQRAMFALRVTSDDGGLEHAAFEREFGEPTAAVFGDFLREMQELGLVRDDGEKARLTGAGMLLGDEVCARLYTPELRHRMRARMKVDAAGDAVVAPRGSRRRSAEHRDVLIIGGGVAGLATAAALSRDLGAGIALVEAEATLGAGATGASIGGFRAQFTDPLLAEMTAASLPALRALADDPGVHLDLREDGYLFVATTERDADLLHRQAARAAEVGLPPRELSPAEVARRLPGMHTDDLRCAFLGEREGHLDPHGLVQALDRRSRAAGARITTSARVSELLVEKERVIGARVGGPDGIRTITANTVVLAAGTASIGLLEAAGVRLPARVGHRRIFIARGPGLPPAGGPLVLCHDPRLYFRADSGGLLISAWEFTARAGATADILADLVDRAAHRLPGLMDAGITLAWAGAQVHTPDGRPWVGPCPGLDGLVLATGLAGHGLMHAPVIGELTAAHVLGEAVGRRAEALDPRRVRISEPEG